MCPSGQRSSAGHSGLAKPRFCALWEMSVLCLLLVHPVHAHVCDELPVLQVEGATSLHIHGRLPVPSFANGLHLGRPPWLCSSPGVVPILALSPGALTCPGGHLEILVTPTYEEPSRSNPPPMLSERWGLHLINVKGTKITVHNLQNGGRWLNLHIHQEILSCA